MPFPAASGACPVGGWALLAVYAVEHTRVAREDLRPFLRPEYPQEQEEEVMRKKPKIRRTLIAHLAAVRPDIAEPAAAIAAGRVRVNGSIMTNPASLVQTDASVVVVQSTPLRGKRNCPPRSKPLRSRSLPVRRRRFFFRLHAGAPSSGEHDESTPMR